VATKAAPMEIYGLEGALVVERPGVAVPPTRLALELFSTNVAPGARSWTSMMRVGPDRARLLQRASLVDHLADCLETGAPLQVGPERARHVLEVMLAAETSAREGRVVGLTTTFPTDD
jgi:predicted dehydrogenase